MSKLENNKINWTCFWVLDKILQTLSLSCNTSTDSASFPRKQTAPCKDLSAVPPKLLLQTYLWALQKNVERGAMNEYRFLFPVVLLFSSRRHALLLNMENFWRLSLFLWLNQCTTAWAWFQLSNILLPFRSSHITPFSIIRQARFSYLSRPLYVH